MIFAIENSDMKNAIHLFEINIQFKKKPQTRQKENKNGGKRNERKVRKKKKKLVHIKLLLFRILRRE